ncbi:hypothetical protein DFA_09130 [Cavenderia fasciculata]|uniref:CCZ1/INTU/HSP4 first Longin domain-containing protein n=1 Tax=Cavenderia fasciculata TaxID=261658 RepID=F4Q6S3_CACFS|nr:uncharacterized protein DFA_09130 [Cavenderia fasciculata]EGG16583.1 hypothetical protein DFA_09130 [Cavenderia fasciculata]|eukprot:XP_004354983.1 hypothetical protein DFA_09130 [Cavenderia fasciculata]
MSITDVSLNYFLVYNPKLGLKEGTEHEKILFFHPQQNFNIGIQTNIVGLTEAYVLCTKQFSPDKPCEYIHTMKHSIALLQPEPDIWMVIALNNPSGSADGGKTGKREYLEDEIDDILLQTILQQTYDLWRMFNGPMQDISKKRSLDILKKRLDTFYRPYLQLINFEQLDIFTTLDGIQFLPTDKNVFLKMLSMVNGCEIAFQSACPSFRFAALFFKDHLMYGNLSQHQTRTLNHYLIHLIKVGTDRSSTNSIMATNVDGEFIWGTKGQKKNGFLIEPTNSPILPLVYIGDTCNYMIIYEHKDTVCIFLVDQNDLKNIKLDDIKTSLSAQIDYVFPVLDQRYSQKSFMEEQYKYIFFNQMNLAIKASLKLKGGVELTKETLKILNEMHTDFESNPENITEATVKTQNDRWIVGRKTDSREFYVIFDTKSTSLLEINEEMKNIASVMLKNHFLD